MPSSAQWLFSVAPDKSEQPGRSLEKSTDLPPFSFLNSALSGCLPSQTSTQDKGTVRNASGRLGEKILKDDFRGTVQKAERPEQNEAQRPFETSNRVANGRYQVSWVAANLIPSAPKTNNEPRHA
jgi:hypothetical protein